MKAAGIYHETSAYIGFIGFRVSKGDVFEYGDEFPVGFREGISVKIPDPNPAMCGGLFPVHPSTEIPANKDIGHNFEMRISVPNPGEVFFKPDRKVDFLPDLPDAGEPQRLIEIDDAVLVDDVLQIDVPTDADRRLAVESSFVALVGTDVGSDASFVLQDHVGDELQERGGVRMTLGLGIEGLEMWSVPEPQVPARYVFDGVHVDISLEFGILGFDDKDVCVLAHCNSL